MKLFRCSNIWFCLDFRPNHYLNFLSLITSYITFLKLLFSIYLGNYLLRATADARFGLNLRLIKERNVISGYHSGDGNGAVDYHFLPSIKIHPVRTTQYTCLPKFLSTVPSSVLITGVLCVLVKPAHILCISIRLWNKTPHKSL